VCDKSKKNTVTRRERIHIFWKLEDFLETSQNKTLKKKFFEMYDMVKHHAENSVGKGTIIGTLPIYRAFK
jgi:hypothetical protein